MVDHDAAARPQPAVGERQQRLVHALEQRIDALDRQRPARIRVDDRQLAAPPALDLVLEQGRQQARGARTGAAEAVAHDQHLPGAMPRRQSSSQDPADRVGLVGQARFAVHQPDALPIDAIAPPSRG